MPKPERMILVCTNTRPPAHPKGSCGACGAGDLLAAMKEERDARELKGRISVAGTSCLGPCLYGPVVAVMPDNVWYGKVGKGDVREIMESHVLGGKPVERLLLPNEAWG